VNVNIPHHHKININKNSNMYMLNINDIKRIGGVAAVAAAALFAVSGCGNFSENYQNAKAAYMEEVSPSSIAEASLPLTLTAQGHRFTVTGVEAALDVYGRVDEGATFYLFRQPQGHLIGKGDLVKYRVTLRGRLEEVPAQGDTCAFTSLFQTRALINNSLSWPWSDIRWDGSWEKYGAPPLYAPGKGPFTAVLVFSTSTKPEALVINSIADPSKKHRIPIK